MFRLERRRSYVALVLAGVMCLFVASCGGDDDDDGTAGGGDTSQTDDDTDTTGGGTVEAQTIKIGYAYADLAEFAAVNPAFGIGDPDEHMQAVLDHLRSTGAIPVDGSVDIELVTRKFGVLGDDEKLAVCQQFAEEDEVLAVIAGREFTAGAQCLASRFQIPVVSVNGMPTSEYEPNMPYVFTLRTDESSATNQFIAWVTDNGLVDGKKVGLVVDQRQTEVNEILESGLEDAGADIVSLVESSGEGVGSEQDALAAQRLQADGAEVAILTIGSTSAGNFMTAAAEQNYTPTYIDFDIATHMSDTAAGSLPQEQYDGTQGIASVRVGDRSDGLPDQAEECMAAYEEYSGKSFERTPPETGETSNILITCDVLNVLVTGIQNAIASGEVTQDSLIAGLEAISDWEGAYYQNITFSADDHSGSATWREVTYSADCMCFEPQSDWQPLDS